MEPEAEAEAEAESARARTAAAAAAAASASAQHAATEAGRTTISGGGLKRTVCQLVDCMFSQWSTVGQTKGYENLI